jgi:hypothetical protein
MDCPFKNWPLPESCRNRKNPDQAFNQRTWELEMAYIQQRGEFWRVEIRRRGHKPIYHTFDTLKKAQQEARRIEAAMDAGSFVDQSEAEKTTLRQALERYRREVVPNKRHPYQEERRIDRWLETDLAYKTLAGLRGADFAQYRDQRRALGRAENTIRLELQLVSHLFEIARKNGDWRDSSIR